MAARHTQSRRRSSAPVKPAPRQRSQSNLAGPEHAARASAQVDAAVSAVDAWYESGEPSGEIDLTDSSVAAVDAAKRRAADLGAVATQAPGKRVVVRLRASDPRGPRQLGDLADDASESVDPSDGG